MRGASFQSRLAGHLGKSVGVVAILITACSAQRPVLDTVAVENEIRASLGAIDDLDVERVECERSVDITPQGTFVCTADIEGQQLHYDATQTDTAGEFSGDFREAIVVMDRVENQVLDTLAVEDISIECDERAHRIMARGETLDCLLTDRWGEEAMIGLEVISVRGEVRIVSDGRDAGFGYNDHDAVRGTPSEAIAAAFLEGTGVELDEVDCPELQPQEVEAGVRCEAHLGDQTLRYAVDFNKDGTLRSYQPESAVILVDAVVARIESQMEDADIEAEVDCGEQRLRFLDIDDRFECTVTDDDERGVVGVVVEDVYGTVTLEPREVRDIE